MEFIFLKITAFFSELWVLLTEMGPYLLFGFLFAGILHVFLQREKVGSMLNGNTFHSVINATLLGIPLPLCSCGVIPAGLSFHKNGASKGPTVSFLISTPQTGVDSVLVTYALLGLPFALIRPVAALITGIAGGLWVNRSGGKKEIANPIRSVIRSQKSFINNLREVFYYGFYELIKDISKWLIIGLLMAALLAVIIPDDFFTMYVNKPWLNMFLVLLASVPLYVCATGSVPIAAVLLMKGLSPGAALVFLMAGPATNIATITVLWKELGKRVTLIYLSTIISGALVFGLLIDLLLPPEWFSMKGLGHVHHHFLPHWLGITSAALLVILVINGFFQKWITEIKNKKIKKQMSVNVNVQKFLVGGMTCKNCKAHVERDVSAIDGVESSIADLETGELTVSGQAIDPTKIGEAVEKAGYHFKGPL